MRGESSVAGEGRVFSVPKVHSWDKYTMPLTNINSDWMFNASSGLCINLNYLFTQVLYFASWGVINFNWQSRSQCQCLWPLMLDILLVTVIQSVEFQCLSLSDSAPPIRNVHTRNSWASSWLSITLALFRPWLLCTSTREKRLPGIYPCYLYSWEQDSTLWPDTLTIFILHFRSLWDVFVLQDHIAHSEVQDSLMCSACRILFACYQQMILCYKTQCYCIELWWCYIVMQCTITDSTAPGTIYSLRGFPIYGRIYKASTDNLQDILASHSQLRTQSHYADWEREK